MRQRCMAWQGGYRYSGAAGHGAAVRCEGEQNGSRRAAAADNSDDKKQRRWAQARERKNNRAALCLSIFILAFQVRCGHHRSSAACYDSLFCSGDRPALPLPQLPLQLPPAFCSVSILAFQVRCGHHRTVAARSAVATVSSPAVAVRFLPLSLFLF
ncbi:unnamed protein product [Victoria cruziana]